MLNYLKKLLCVSLATILCVQPCFATLPEEGIIDYFDNNGIYYYNPVGDRDNCGSSATRLAGNTVAEKIWNYFVDKGFTDGQIAGIIGNGMAESGLTPTRSVDGSYWGIFQWGPRRPQLWQKMEEARLGKYLSPEYWGAGAEEMIPEADLDAILTVELDFLMGPDDISWIDAIKETNDPETAAEIFLVTFERAVGGNDPITLYPPYMGLLYQGTTARRKFAREAYDEYSGKGVSVSVSKENSGKDITIIGDSITVGSTSAIKEVFSDITDDQIDARVSRPWAEGLQIAKKMELKDTVIFALGTNNVSLTSSDIDELISIVGSNRTIVLLTNHGPAGYEINNALFEEYAKQNSNIILADWNTEVSKDPSKYLASDDVHPTAEGAKLFAQLISDAINGNLHNGCSVNGEFLELVLAYAWPTYHNAPFTEKMPAYAAAVDQSIAEGRFTGGGPNGGPGIDCGGFVTILVQNSGLAPDYNTNPPGGTTRQEQWVQEQNWTLINASPNTEVDTSLLQAGDVAFSDGHTFIYVGEIPGFDSVIASASIGGDTARAPMAGSEGLLTGNGAIVRWYRSPTYNPKNTPGTRATTPGGLIPN